MNNLFIIGSPRSGTSLLRMLLTSHPETVIPPECHFFLWLEDKYSSWDSNEDLNTFLNDLYTSKKFETWELDRSYLTDFISKHCPTTYSELVEAVYLAYGRTNGKRSLKYWGDKNGLWRTKLPKLLHYYPNAKFIHIVRDGRDVACSYRELAKKSIDSKYAPNLPTDMVEIASRWVNDINAIRDLLSSAPDRNTTEIRYEDLICGTREVLAKICKFLELEYSENMLYYKQDTKSSMFEPAEFQQWKPKLTESPDPDNIEKYKFQLSTKETSTFENFSFHHLMCYGYTL